MTSALDVLARYGYLVVFGAVFAEQIGLPFPSEPFLLATGGAAGSLLPHPTANGSDSASAST